MTRHSVTSLGRAVCLHCCIHVDGRVLRAAHVQRGVRKQLVAGLGDK